MKIYLWCFLAFVSVTSAAQETYKEPPRLVVGIVVDQMRYDYITRYWNHFSDGGFKKLVSKGYNCTNTHYNYVPTYTAPGHASIYTGATPSVHGIIGNEWYLKKQGRTVYCTQDSSVSGVGTDSRSGRMSPRNLRVRTITDELHLATAFKSKVISVSIKDRGAILPGGFTADAAVWFEAKSGKWISSSWYGNDLPKWAHKMNTDRKVDEYLVKWEPLDVTKSIKSYPDEQPYEGVLHGETGSGFPHDLKRSRDSIGYDIIRHSPFGNTITKDLAIAALEGEKLGEDDVPDFLAVSFSSTDYIGHFWGPYSVELTDAYLRLDRDLEQLIDAVEKKVGSDKVLFFLTSDHGVTPNPGFLGHFRIRSGRFEKEEIKRFLNNRLQEKYGWSEMVQQVSNMQVYLSSQAVSESKHDLRTVQRMVADAAIQMEGIENAYPSYLMFENDFTEGPAAALQNGYYRKLSGDVILQPSAGYIEYGATGTTHGSHFSYDTHVPLIWYGWKIKQGKSSQRVNITSIAPTLSSVLNIPLPEGTTDSPLDFIYE